MYSNDIGIVYFIHSASKNLYYLKLAPPVSIYSIISRDIV